MGIDLITAMKLPKQQPTLTVQTTLPQTKTISTNQQTSQEKRDIKETLKKNSPYIAGAILLAGLGYYALNHRGKIKKQDAEDIVDIVADGGDKIKNKIKNKTDDIIDTLAKELTEKTKEKNGNVVEVITENTTGNKKASEEIKVITDKSRLLPLPQGQLKKLDEILNPNKDIKIKLPENFLKPKTEKTTKVSTINVTDTTKKTKQLKKISKKTVKKATNKLEKQKNSLKLNDETIMKKITDNRTKQNDDINRIIGENTRDGQIDFNIMRKVANDFAADEKGRGTDRFHQAADLLEQTYIRTFVKGDANEKSGLKEFTKALFSDKDLGAIYEKMTKPEVANRLNYLKENDLKSLNYKEMSAEDFFEIGLKKILEKFGKKTTKKS